MSSITRRQFLIDGGKVVAGASVFGSVLAACGSGGGTNPTPSQVSLAYWALGYQPGGTTPTGKLTDSAVAAFMKSHAGTKVSVTGYTGDQAGYTKLTQAIQSGGTVDVFRISADELPVLVKQNLVTPIDNYLSASDKSDIYPGLFNEISSNGQHYAWPLWVPPVGMYVNLDVFHERGVDPPADDWTYEQFVEIAQKLTFTRSNGEKVYGYASVIDPGVLNAWPIIMGDGGMPFNQNNTQYTLNSAQGISGLQKLVDLARKYHVTPPDFGGSLAASDIQTAFGQRKTYAMYSAPSGDAAIYQSAGLNFDVKPMPIGGRGQHFTTGGIGLIAVASIQDQDRLKTAMELGNYLTSAQVGQDVQGYYLAPGARKSVQVSGPISKFTSFVPYTWIAPFISQWTQIRTLLHPQIQKAILGQISASDALNGPASEINSLLSGS